MTYVVLTAKLELEVKWNIFISELLTTTSSEVIHSKDKLALQIAFRVDGGLRED